MGVAACAQDGAVEPWPPSREALAAAFADGQTLEVIGRRHGRSRASVSVLAARYGLSPARDLHRPSDDEIEALAASGIGDTRAAQVFGVHRSTYRSWRRRIRDRRGGVQAPRRGDPAAYGFDRGAGWPAGVRFEDDPCAAAADRTGRLRRPGTVIEGASSLAAMTG